MSAMATAIETSHSHLMQITITQISKLVSIFTSEVLIFGIPWKVKILKNEADAENPACLAVRLICVHKDKSLKWTVPGTVSCKLLPFGEDLDALEGHLRPDVFDRTRLNGIGFLECIPWQDLFDETKCYVKDEAIKLEIKIQAENPNSPMRSGVKFDNLGKSCRDECVIKYRLTIVNIANLMAVRTPRFYLRGLSWNITVGKDNASNSLFALLDFDESTKEISCKLAWSIKLTSLNEDIDPIEKTQTELLHSSDYLIMDDIVSWKEIVKPENGYINNNSIVFDVEFRADKPRGDVPISMPNAKRAKTDPLNVTMSPQMECAVCLECINTQELGVTPCGHLFCLACIQKAIASRGLCPTCNTSVPSSSLRRLFLPV